MLNFSRAIVGLLLSIFDILEESILSNIDIVKREIFFFKERLPLVRTGAKEMPPAGGRVKGGILFRKREYPLWNPKRKAFIASEQLEELQCLPIALPIARRCRVSTATRSASTSIIRCRSAHLVEVQPNFRLPEHFTMRRAQQCRYFARSLPPMRTSLAPHDSKARLRTATTRRSFMAKPCTPHPHCAARAVFQE